MSDTSLQRLAEKVANQKRVGDSLKKKLYSAIEEAMKVSVEDGGFCLDEVQSFSQQAFAQILGQMRAKAEGKKYVEEKPKQIGALEGV